MKTNVLIAIPQLTGGGAERVASAWANDLADRKYDVTIAVCARFPDEYETNQKVKIESIAGNLKQYLTLSYLQRLRRIRSILRMRKPDYIISFLPAMQVWIMLASFGMKVKRIETIRVNPWKISVRNPLQVFFWKLCYRTSYRTILQSSDQCGFFSPVVQRKSIVIPNPISKQYIENYKEDSSETPTEFIAAGRIDAQKNYPMMINGFAKACKRFPNIRLRIFGTGPEAYVSEIKKYIDSKGMEHNVLLLGRTPHMENEYPKSDVFLMISDFERMPNALAEAMASRLVCISTD